MSVTLATIIVAVGLVTATVSLITSLIVRCGEGAEVLPESIELSVDFSETDQKYIELTKDMILKCFGEDVLEKYKYASNMDRIRMTQEFATRLAVEYGLDDIKVDVDISSPEHCGIYNWNNKEVVFNIYTLTYNGSDPEVFKYIVRNTLLTIIHELRHAVQCRAIEEEGFWDVSEERRIEWANSRLNYIEAEVDYRGYQQQPIEADAIVFSERALKDIV